MNNGTMFSNTVVTYCTSILDSNMPNLSILYSTIKGTPGDIVRDTSGAKQEAFVNMFKYLQAKVSVTGSCLSIIFFFVNIYGLGQFDITIINIYCLTHSLMDDITTDSPYL